MRVALASRITVISGFGLFHADSKPPTSHAYARRRVPPLDFLLELMDRNESAICDGLKNAGQSPLKLRLNPLTPSPFQSTRTTCKTVILGIIGRRFIVCSIRTRVCMSDEFSKNQAVYFAFLMKMEHRR